MNHESGKFKGRREFLQDGIRIALVGGFALLGISLGQRALSDPGEKSTCPIDTPCRGCSILASCRESRAIITREKRLRPDHPSGHPESRGKI